MKSLHKIAIGLVLVILDVTVNGFDVIPDVIGWLFVLAGLADERRRFPGSGGLLAAAGVATGVAVLLSVPDLIPDDEASVLWMLSLPQIVFSFLLCTTLAGYLAPEAVPTRRFAGLRWVYVVIAVAPILIFGGGLDPVAVPTAITATIADLYLIFLLFKSAGLAESQAIVRYDEGPPPAGDGPS